MSITKEEAIQLATSKFWEHLTHRQIAEFQLSARLLCMPFNVFHEALEKALGRPVWTHELGLNWKGIEAELFDGKPPPTFKEIMDLIPAEKRLVVVMPGGGR